MKDVRSRRVCFLANSLYLAVKIGAISWTLLIRVSDCLYIRERRKTQKTDRRETKQRKQETEKRYQREKNTETEIQREKIRSQKTESKRGRHTEGKVED